MSLAYEREKTAQDRAGGDIAALMLEMGRNARRAAATLAHAGTAAKDEALRAGAGALRTRASEILHANAEDLACAEAAGLSPALLDRLRVDDERIEAMAAGLETIAGLPDPVGVVIASWKRPNGLVIERVRVPLGVIGIIYESRPNVTADAGALCLKSGNATILRGGSESFASSRAILACLHEGVESAGLPADAVQMVPTRDRAAVGHMLAGLEGAIDLIVPRGGKGLVARVQKEARVPVFGHLEGVCHVYVDKAADLDMAREIVLNAKLRRPGICGAAETLLVDRAAADSHLMPLLDALIEAGCEVRGDEDTVAAEPRAKPAEEGDWSSEYLDRIISVRLVDGVAGAIDHIRRYGTGHTESIVTADEAASERFLREVDSAIVLHNASTQFADGGEFGFGSEIGIATGRMHARGPVGLEQLTTFKYVVRGSGQCRP